MSRNVLTGIYLRKLHLSNGNRSGYRSIGWSSNRIFNSIKRLSEHRTRDLAFFYPSAIKSTASRLLLHYFILFKSTPKVCADAYNRVFLLIVAPFSVTLFLRDRYVAEQQQMEEYLRRQICSGLKRQCQMPCKRS